MEPQYLYAMWSNLEPGLKSDWPKLHMAEDYETRVADPKLKKLLHSQRDNFFIKNNTVFKKVKHKDRMDYHLLRTEEYIPSYNN